MFHFPKQSNPFIYITCSKRSALPIQLGLQGALEQNKHELMKCEETWKWNNSSTHGKSNNEALSSHLVLTRCHWDNPTLM